MSSSPAIETSTPAPSSPAPRAPDYHFQTSTPNYLKKQSQPLSVVLSATAPSTPPTYGEPTLTPPPRSPGAPLATPASGDVRVHPLDGTSSDKSSETAVGGISRTPSAALSRKESYKAQRQHYRKEKKRAATALLHSIEDPSVVVLADWLKVRGSLKSWTKLWCVLKPGLLLLYKSPKAKRSHWVGTVLLTSCQVIERPSKKDGFCFKLYHPLEQSIWAPRGPHNETIGAVVQPLPTAHLIFRAPSQTAGHCWLDGLELALRCSNAMLRCSRSRPEAAVEDAPASQTNISHEELEKHFNEHDFKPPHSTCASPSPLLNIQDYSPKAKHANFDAKLAVFKIDKSKSLTTSPFKIDLTKCFELRKLSLTEKLHDKCTSPTSIIEENLTKIFAKRRSSTPSATKPSSSPKKISEFRKSVKTDSENDDALNSRMIECTRESEVLFSSPENILITKTAPSMERFGGQSVDLSSSTDDCRNSSRYNIRSSPSYSKKYSLINYDRLPSANFEVNQSVRRDDRYTTQDVYIAGKIVRSELAGAASDTDSEGSRPGMPDSQITDPGSRKRDILARIQSFYAEDPDTEIGVAGELVEEVAEENKSLLWFLLKQVRPGMDLSKVVLPTFILEPRSFLDKLSDNYYHADLLSQAQAAEDPYQRFKGVLKWYLSGLYRKPKGLKKPYNPVLGETFRCCWRHTDNETYTYYIAEQVSHHPPVSAFYISNRKDGFVIEGSLLARSKFYGNSTSAILEGCARIHFLNWGETYITTAPYAHCKGIVIGTLSMELGGKVHVMCQETGYQADVEFKLRSFLGGADQTNAISGRIKKGKDTIAFVEGYWDGKIDIKDKRTGEETNLLDVAILKEHRLPRYLVKLDKQQEWESQRLWIKVSEAIHNEDQIVATEQKTVIEEAQRARARNLVSPWMPRLFHRGDGALPPEGITDQGWKYNHTSTRFCPSVFLYLALTVPAIWLLELHNVDKQLQKKMNITVIEAEIMIPGATKIPREMWVTVIEQFLMLTLIVGRWLLPKGDLTRDQLSQLLLVYIGTAADIIEFFDSFKDEKVVTEKLLILLTLGIWSWSLMQFTVVLTATKSRKSRGTANRNPSRACCCSIEVCAIIMNIALQDAPFLAFRLLIIAHYKIINYMNIFFTCKNTLVILLQIYRLYVLHLETLEEVNSGSVYRKRRKHKPSEKKERDKKRRDPKIKKHKRKPEIGETSIAVISDPRRDGRVESGRIRAIILTNTDEIKELELSKFFKDQVTMEKEKKKSSKKKQKSESSEESLNNIQHTTDDSGI
ncbi:oxysterol-binding protein-related protein 8-like isoform X2 [Maniola hyperantus]|uniref:oxysterol-binding protein-related protein 8-like isoform X2 n=1 Tax=Aphantopus hyperantus TaxID=2795564 RepID=UPI00374A887B